jgi:hypothetical protein
MTHNIKAMLVMARERHSTLLDALESCGIEVLPVCDCSEARRMLEAQPIVQVVVTDARLGRGWKRARTNLSTAPVPYPTTVLQGSQAEPQGNRGARQNPIRSPYQMPSPEVATLSRWGAITSRSRSPICSESKAGVDWVSDWTSGPTRGNPAERRAGVIRVADDQQAPF